MSDTPEEKPHNPIQEIIQPFIDLAHAPRALWGVNLSYLVEGMVYFGIVGLLAMYFSAEKGYVGLSELEAHPMVGALTWGITLSMFFFGGLADRWGVRTALLLALLLMLVGRVILSAAPMMGLANGWLSPLHLLVMLGLLFVVLGYGMYQPAAYSAIRHFTTEKTAAMGYAMLYAVMNLGGWLPTFVSPPVRKAHGIMGVFWVFTGCTVLALVITYAILSRRTVDDAIASAKAEREKEQAHKKGAKDSDKDRPADKPKQPFSLLRWIKEHPMADAKFSYFIFCLIPVQSLFAYNWLVLPQYVDRAYRGTWLGDNFEAATNFNPILIFILVPMVAAVSRKANVYKMMIFGTLVMAAPSFLLVLGPSFWTLLGYLVIMTIGEAMWQPRFLQYAAEIAPEGRTGAYMGVAQFPWFLTKMICSLYTGWFMSIYCPEPYRLHLTNNPVWGGLFKVQDMVLNTETMWGYFGLIAISSTVLLVLAKGWLGKDFKTKAD